MVDSTVFLNLVMWGKIAENFVEYCKKGDPIFIEGKIQIDKWTTEEGQNRTKTKILVNNFQLLKNKNDNKVQEDIPT